MHPLLNAIRGSQSPKEWRACALLILCALAFSVMTVCVKQLGGELPVAEIVLVRSLISILITLVMLKQAQVSPWGQQRSLLLLRGVLGTTALLCFFEALARLPLAAATLLQYTYPTLTALSAWVWLGEPIRRRIGLAVLLGLAGVMLVVQPEWIGSPVLGSLTGSSTTSLAPSTAALPAIAVVIGLAGALLTALAYVSVRQLSVREHPLVIVFYFPLVSVPATLPFLWGDAIWPSSVQWFWLVGVGVFTQLGQVWLTEGLATLPAARATSINYVQVVFAALWGVMFFAEPITSTMVVGAACVLGATLISLSARQPR
ncbi:DMT family transporter [Synechococcus sp. UW105]|uniref:DMT family transporter n=1 Tax=Synechococcus sp. UW105 TaxID=337067 RepID=UPI000E0E7923|nr:DMT family transporter [Synechococcus sp. UW105]